MEITKLIDTGVLRTVVREILPIDAAAQAYSPTKIKGFGKTLLQVVDSVGKAKFEIKATDEKWRKQFFSPVSQVVILLSLAATLPGLRNARWDPLEREGESLPRFDLVGIPYASFAGA
jgi:hypothetical protein